MKASEGASTNLWLPDSICDSDLPTDEVAAAAPPPDGDDDAVTDDDVGIDIVAVPPTVGAQPSAHARIAR